jgi:flagellar basal-body rod modification protein FlgD
MAGLNVDAVTNLQNSTFAPKQNTGAEMGQVDFMKLIIAQMRNQNPLEPQKDTDFMAQMAQFEALNQMKSVAQGIKAMQGVQELAGATAMLGKTVVGKQVNATPIVRDLVSRELWGTSYANISGQQRVDVNNDERVLAAAQDAENAGREVGGVVTRVTAGPDGIPMLFVGGRVVDMFTVSEVR